LVLSFVLYNNSFGWWLEEFDGWCRKSDFKDLLHYSWVF